jgi:hypothetical protein
MIDRALVWVEASAAELVGCFPDSVALGVYGPDDTAAAAAWDEVMSLAEGNELPEQVVRCDFLW